MKKLFVFGYYFVADSKSKAKLNDVFSVLTQTRHLTTPDYCIHKIIFVICHQNLLFRVVKKFLWKITNGNCIISLTVSFEIPLAVNGNCIFWDTVTVNGNGNCIFFANGYNTSMYQNTVKYST